MSAKKTYRVPGEAGDEVDLRTPVMPCPRIVATPSERRVERQMAAEQTYENIVLQDNLGLDGFVAGLQGEFGPGMDERYGRLIVEKNLWAEALGLAFHDDSRVAFRASWALEWAYFNYKEMFVPYISRFFENYLVATNPSVHRHYTKMLCDMMRCGMFVPETSQMEQIAEKTFDLLIGAQTKSAVRVWAAEILFELSSVLGWVGEHLAEVLRQQMETIPTPAILNHYGKLLRRINTSRR